MDSTAECATEPIFRRVGTAHHVSDFSPICAIAQTAGPCHPGFAKIKYSRSLRHHNGTEGDLLPTDGNTQMEHEFEDWSRMTWVFSRNGAREIVRYRIVWKVRGFYEPGSMRRHVNARQKLPCPLIPLQHA